MSEFQRKEVGTHGEDVPINRVSSLDSPTNDLRELDTGSKENLMDIQGVRIQEYFPKEDRVMHNKTEEQDRSTNKQRRIYSSTSSVYAEHTISDPNNDQVLYCIAAVLQAQMFDDFYNDEFSSLAYPQFNIPVALAVEYGGERETIPEEILRHETLNDNELRDLLLQKALPTVDTIYRFFKYLMVLTDYSIECNILALVYINRITVKNNIAVNMENWRGLWLGAIILAQKVWDDNPLKTSSFSSVLTSVSKEALIAAEMKVFSLLEYSTTVRPSVYVKYFLELHELFREITGGDSNGFRWHLHPMTLAEKKRLELRSKRHGREYRKNHKVSSSSSFTTTSSASISIVSSKAVTPLNIRTEQPTAVTTANTATAAVNALSFGTSKSSPSTSNFTTKTLKNSDAEHPRSITLEDATYASVSRYVIN